MNDNQFSGIFDLLSCYDFVNCHKLVTRPNSQTCFDHVYSNIGKPIGIASIECKLSDHNFLYISLESNVHLSGIMKSNYSVCDYDMLRRCSREHLDQLMIVGHPSIDMDNLIASVNAAVSNSTVIKAGRKCLRGELTPSINGNLYKLITYKKRLLKLRRKSPDNVSIGERLKRISRVIKRATKDSMNDYYVNCISSFHNNSRKTCKFLNDTLGRNINRITLVKYLDGVLLKDDSAMAQKLNDHFIDSISTLKTKIETLVGDNINALMTLQHSSSRLVLEGTTISEISDEISDLSIGKSCGHDNISPRVLRECCNSVAPHLTSILNSTIRNGSYPDILKVHKIIPIAKDRNDFSIDKFRPISVLPVINKIFERIIHRQMFTYFEPNNFLYEHQYGFRKGCGTEEATMNVQNYICKMLDNGYSGVVGIFFDLSKALDMIDHGILLQKLYTYGLRGKELQLIESYLSDRKQFVQINEHRSGMSAVQYGVPQGSVLGPLLFAIYINDIKNLHLFGKMFLYADDICLFYPFKYGISARPYIERDSALILEFMRINRLFINDRKTRLIRFRPYTRSDAAFAVNIGGNLITEMDRSNIWDFIYNLICHGINIYAT
ncbi:uncharacterized protein LOC142230850 [Haematobia irritans]|uniref:uncharacterized protein LOC142230850 n=1 Tax=Haematobia irritans TaxID=7368 RepID=UPI003F4F471C